MSMFVSLLLAGVVGGVTTIVGFGLLFGVVILIEQSKKKKQLNDLQNMLKGDLDAGA